MRAGHSQKNKKENLKFATTDRSLRKMAGITIFDVKEQRITNKQVRKRLGNCHSLHQFIEISRSKWLQKLAKMNHNRKPKKVLKYWIFKKPRLVLGRRQECIETSKSKIKMITNSLGLNTKRQPQWLDENKQSNMETQNCCNCIIQTRHRLQHKKIVLYRRN